MKIGIIFAMKEELNALKKHLKIERQFKIYDLVFYEAKYKSITCILVESGIGKVNAARCTQVLIDNIDVDFTGEYSTLIVKQLDKPGVVAWLTSCLASQDVNIAFMRLFREAKGEVAYTIIESDHKIPADVLDALGMHKHVLTTRLVQI